jgi:hypothetical protein
MEREWELKMLTLLKGKGFNDSVLFDNVESLNSYYPLIAFSVKVEDLQLCFAIEYFVEGLKPFARITVSSPNKKGFFEKKATGKNTTPEKVLDIVKSIWDRKYQK